jgi:hypothetical protein
MQQKRELVYYFGYSLPMLCKQLSTQISTAVSGNWIRKLLIYLSNPKGADFPNDVDARRNAGGAQRKRSKPRRTLGRKGCKKIEVAGGFQTRYLGPRFLHAEQ